MFVKCLRISFSRWFYQIDVSVRFLMSCTKEKLVYWAGRHQSDHTHVSISGKHREMPLDLAVLQILKSANC